MIFFVVLVHVLPLFADSTASSDLRALPDLSSTDLSATDSSNGSRLQQANKATNNEANNQALLNVPKKSAEEVVEKSFTVVLDPGHPSENGNGCTGFGLKEFEINFEIAVEVKKILEQQPNIKVLFTKNEVNELVKNIQRAEIANNARADLLFRIHCDSGSGSGYALYYPDSQGTKDGKTGPSAEVIYKSRQAVEKIHSGIFSVLEGKLRDNGIKTDRQTFIGKKQGALTGSIFSQVPLVTIEMIFLSSKNDADFIRSLEGKKLMSQAIASGILHTALSEKSAR
ncbi:MAG: N-acetylmuramoyl-L-alanine amidase [Candidatus Riflebacteria bacterium]|nr:N-acetylmuramoyl-L-alanine amidase [Candidatus Riflebacteria bacterium]